jgi:hypothetical protein
VIAQIFIPVCMLIAIVRANYFDVDRLITGTAVYSVLSILLLAAALIAVPHLARAASRAAGFDPHAMQWGLALLVAAGTVPASRLLSPRIERVLFHERTRCAPVSGTSSRILRLHRVPTGCWRWSASAWTRWSGRAPA